MKRLKFLFVAFFLFSFVGPVFALSFPTVTRQEIQLSGEWQYRIMNDAKPVYPAPQDEWKSITVPCEFPSLTTTKPSEKVQSVFVKREIIIPSDYKDKHIRLEFETVGRWSRIYFNGEQVGDNFSAIAPISIDITNKVKFGVSNEILIWLTEDQTPETAACSVAYWKINGIGIRGKVKIGIYPIVYIENVFIKPSVRKKEFTVDFTLVNSGSEKQDVVLHNSIVEWKKDEDIFKSKSILDLKDESIVLLPGQSQKVSITQKWDEPHLWSYDDPFLYVLRTEILRDPYFRMGTPPQNDRLGGVVDTVANRFGFREIWIEGKDFVLNGTKVHFYGVWGVNVWEMSDRGEEFFKKLKKSNMNIIRAQRWIDRVDDILDCADEIGMLIAYHNLGMNVQSPYRDRQEFWDNTTDIIKRAIETYRNHPSIVLWSLSAEWVQTAGKKWQYQVDKLWELHQVVNKIDPTRPAYQSGSGALQGKTEVIDVRYVNELVYGGPKLGYSAGSMPDGAYWWEDAKELRSAWLQYNEPIVDKPIFIGESTHIWTAVLDSDAPEVYYYWLGEKTYELIPKKIDELLTAAMWGHKAVIAGIRDFGVNILVEGNTPDYSGWQRMFHPNAVNIREMDNRFFIGDKVKRTLSCYNDLMIGKSDMLIKWKAEDVNGKEIAKGEKKIEVSGGEKVKFEIEFKVSDINHGKGYEFGLHTQSYVNGKLKFEETTPMKAYPRPEPKVILKKPVLLFDALKNTEQTLNALGIKKIEKIKDLDKEILSNTNSILIIGKDSLVVCLKKNKVEEIKKVLADYTSKGGVVIILEQEKLECQLLPLDIGHDDETYAKWATTSSILAPNHKIMNGLKEDDVMFWRGDHFVVKHNLIKPKTGNFIPLIGTGNGATPNVDRTPLMEIRNGKGAYIVSQVLLIEKFRIEPIAPVLLENILNYADSYRTDYCRIGTLLNDGEKAKDIEKYLKKIGIKNKPVQTNELNGVDLLIVGLDNGFPDKTQMGSLKNWINEGGKLFVFGDANTQKEMEFLLGETFKLKREKRNIRKNKPRIGRASANMILAQYMVKIDSQSILLDGVSNGDMHWAVPIVVPFVNISGAGVKQLTEPALLTEVEYGKGKMIICQIPLMDTKATLAKRLGSIIFTNLKVQLGTGLIDTGTVSQETMVYVDIRQYVNMGFEDEIAGDEKGGWTDQGKGMDMPNIPVGIQTFNNISFDIIAPAKNNGKSCIVLRGGAKNYFPYAVNNIPVNNKFKSIHFLLDSAWTTDKPMAKIIVKYTDLFSEEIIINGKQEVGPWCCGSLVDLPNASVAWSGTNGVMPVAMYMTEWENPKPNNTIMDISIVSEGTGVPIFIAITGVQKIEQ